MSRADQMSISRARRFSEDMPGFACSTLACAHLMRYVRPGHPEATTWCRLYRADVESALLPTWCHAHEMKQEAD